MSIVIAEKRFLQSVAKVHSSCLVWRYLSWSYLYHCTAVPTQFILSNTLWSLFNFRSDIEDLMEMEDDEELSEIGKKRAKLEVGTGFAGDLVELQWRSSNQCMNLAGSLRKFRIH